LQQKTSSPANYSMHWLLTDTREEGAVQEEREKDRDKKVKSVSKLEMFDLLTFISPIKKNYLSPWQLKM